MKSILEKSVFVTKIAGKLLLGLEKYSKFTIFIRLNAIKMETNISIQFF